MSDILGTCGVCGSLYYSNNKKIAKNAIIATCSCWVTPESFIHDSNLDYGENESLYWAMREQGTTL